MKVTDLDAWRRVCLKAYENLPANTVVGMADIDAVLLAGARPRCQIDTATQDGAKAYTALLLSVWEARDVDIDDIDAILTWCASDAAGLIED